MYSLNHQIDYWGIFISFFANLISLGVSKIKIEPSCSTDTINYWLGEIAILLIPLECSISFHIGQAKS